MSVFCPIRAATPSANSPSQALELDPSAEGPVKLPAPFRAARGPQFPVRSVTDDMSARRVNWVEVLSTLLLALAAVSTAWASYQASRWQAQQALAGNRSTAARIEANRSSGVANRQIQTDIATFIQWVAAYAQGDTELQPFYFRRFRVEFRPAVTAWIATRPLKNPEAPLTPFVMPQYSSSSEAEADAFEAKADANAAISQRNNEWAGRYVLCVVLMAMTLFFAGISIRLKSGGSREVVLALGWIVFLGTVVWLASFPVTMQL